MHDNTRHADRFTVVGNHLAQHRELTLTAIGIAVHIQSLPAGARIDIKTLAARFPEGETRIAAALRELEAHGYLVRTRERLDSGRIVTRTVSCNQPQTAGSRAQAGPAGRAHARTTRPTQPTPPSPPTRPTPPPPPPPTATVPGPGPGPGIDAAPGPCPDPAPGQLRIAATLLADLRRTDARLLLSERDVDRLSPAVVAWLDRGASPDAVRRTLTAGLPCDLARPAGLLAHRLAELLPPPLPVAPRRPEPLQNCDLCDRAFRGPGPGRCRECV